MVKNETYLGYFTGILDGRDTNSVGFVDDVINFSWSQKSSTGTEHGNFSRLPKSFWWCGAQQLQMRKQRKKDTINLEDLGGGNRSSLNSSSIFNEIIEDHTKPFKRCPTDSRKNKTHVFIPQSPRCSGQPSGRKKNFF